MSGNETGAPGTGMEERKPFILEKPLWRGLFNGVVLCLLMIGAQAQGWLGPSTEVTGTDVTRAVVYGAVFGAVMYLYSLWREKRHNKARNMAAEAARARVEADLGTRDEK